MFGELTDKLSNAFRRIRGVSHLSEDNIAEALKEVRLALLGADVHFKVVREFLEKVKIGCIGQAVTQGVSPAEQFIKVMNDELTALFGEDGPSGNAFPEKKPWRAMLVGLHGSGKTTSAAKLAYLLRKKGYSRPALIACDVYRPAAIDQLEALAKQGDFLFFANRKTQDVVKIAREGMAFAMTQGADAIIFDTAGRLHIDEDLIKEIQQLKASVQPDAVYLVADAALGQEAVNVAKHFHDAMTLTGIILTKLDGDARGGAALSMKAMTGVPIRFLGVGEKIDALELFYPDRMAQRILGMGDVVSLVEKAKEVIDEKEAQKIAGKLEKGQFTLEDMLTQMEQMQKLGPLGSLIKMIPGMHGMEVGDEHLSQMNRTKAIIRSMTLQERRNPNVLNGNRRVRIAAGSGVQLKDVNALIKQFTQMSQMMRSMSGSKGKAMMKRLSSMNAESLMGSDGSFDRR
jgi:signal recognition particle subunit SRP54